MLTNGNRARSLNNDFIGRDSFAWPYFSPEIRQHEDVDHLKPLTLVSKELS